MVQFKIGDRVKTTVQATMFNKGATGVITKEHSHILQGPNTWFTVELDNNGTHLIAANELELDSTVLPKGRSLNSLYGIEGDETEPMMDFFSTSVRSKCECGQSDADWVKHSDYCPLYVK